MGCRKIVRIFKVFAGRIDIAIPHHTTVRQWVIRQGCYSLQAPLERADDWICIGDLTISIGKLKCLATLGVRMSHINSRDDLTLSHDDVELLGLYPTEKSTGSFVKSNLETSANRVGGDFLAITIDQGSDIKMGARLFQESHPKVKILYDISHKLSNIVEHELKKDKRWPEYIQALNMTRKKAFQTDLAALMPKKQREKARFIDIGDIVNWPDRIKQSKIHGHLESISEERFRDYFGWIDNFTTSLDEWKFMEKSVDFVKSTVRKYGYSKGVYIHIKNFFDEAYVEEERLKHFVFKLLNTVMEEVQKLDKREGLIGSTEVLESIFGKYKALNEGLNGITGNILGLCTYVGKAKTENDTKKAMEGCSVKKSMEFLRQKFGKTIASLRKRFFPRIKGTKFDMEKTRCKVA